MGSEWDIWLGFIGGIIFTIGLEAMLVFIALWVIGTWPDNDKGGFPW